MVFGANGLVANGAVVLGAALVVLYVGPRLSRAADSVGSVTGLGQTLAGALLLGASTSLSGLIVSTQTALQGQANLAVANSLGVSRPRRCSSRWRTSRCEAGRWSIATP
jgi:Ca2+/Na+ antiporter